MNAGRRMRLIGVAAALLLLGAEASAQGMGRPMRDRGGQPPQRAMQDSRPAQFTTDDAASQRRRMTPEERRQLRQDVHQAGRDLYPGRMHERRREMRRGE